MNTRCLLLGGYIIPLKNDGVKVSWDDDIPFPTVHGKSVDPFHGSSHHSNQLGLWALPLFLASSKTVCS